MKGHLKVVALVRDIGAGNVIAPVADVLRQRGHSVRLFAEADGQAAKRPQPVPFETLTAKDELEQIVAVERPDIVIAGLSSPRHLEEDLDRIAVARNIPLVHIEDYWGAHVRSPFAADVVITIDAAAAELVRAARPNSRIVLAGFSGITKMAPSQSIADKFAALRQRTGLKYIVYPDGGEECDPALRILVESIQRSRIGFVLIPKIHPKFKDVLTPNSHETWGQWCRRELAPLRNRGMVLECEEPVDELVLAADATASCYSTTLLRAAAAGKGALTLSTPVIKRLLLRETGLSRTPLMMRGGFPILERAMRLDVLLAPPHPRLEIEPFDPIRAADAVEGIAEKLAA